ncbi:MAG: hypothetical protein AAFW01_01365 [Pseudomonadota bacterium]
MDDLDRARGASLAQATARFVADGGVGREAFREELRAVRTAVSNRPPEDLTPLLDGLRDRAVRLETLAAEAESENGRFALATNGGVAALGLAIVGIFSSGASVAFCLAVGVIGAFGAKLSLDRREELQNEGVTLRAAAEDLRELAQSIGERDDR